MRDGVVDELIDKYWILPERQFSQNMNATNWPAILEENNNEEFTVQYNDWRNPRFGAE